MFRKRRLKYGNKKTEYDGIVFDSKAEMARWVELQRQERIGKVSNLQRQVAFELLPNQRDAQGVLVERSIKYIADFVYTLPDGRKVVEDVKGWTINDGVYRIKKKLFRYRYPYFEFVEIMKGKVCEK